MKSADYPTLDFAPHAPTENNEIHCPECGGWYHLSQWKQGRVECEICGDHDTMICPNEDCSGDFNGFLDGPGGSDEPLQVREVTA